MGGGQLVPWVLSIGGGIVATLVAVIGKLWATLKEERSERATERAQLQYELSEATDRVVELQTQAHQRSDDHQREHRRDLRRLAGLPTSGDQWPAVIRPVVREETARGLPPAKKPRG